MNDSGDLSHHILPNSATMVGVCIMVISIIKSLTPNLASYFIDEALAIDSVLFTLSAMLSFMSIRSKTTSVSLENWAESMFLLGLGSMTVIAVIFVFMIS